MVIVDYNCYNYQKIDNKASQKEIESAFRQLSKGCHPDRHASKRNPDLDFVKVNKIPHCFRPFWLLIFLVTKVI